jgi:hypothetical protein
MTEDFGKGSDPGKLPAASHVERHMSYRSDAEAQRAHRDALLRELEEIRARARELRDVTAREEDVKRRLAEVEAQMRAGRRRSLLASVKIASPCRARWEDMAGDDRVRFCGSCAKNVYNVSAMPEDEAERLIASNTDGELCVRLYRRTDGTVMTSDCPEGARRKRVRRVALAVVGGGMVAAAAATALRHHDEEAVVMGSIAMIEAPPRDERHALTEIPVPAAEPTADSSPVVAPRGGYRMGAPGATKPVHR